MNYLQDKDFLKELDRNHEKTVYVRIVSLDIDEKPLETLEGKIMGGNINIDGASAVRRTCSLQIAAEEISLNDFYWGLNTKFKVFIGLKNDINPNYPEICWFNQGIYLITSFSYSISATGMNISVQGKDKMVLLNGEIGGLINAKTDFGTEEYIDENGKYIINKLNVKDIILEAVHTYGNEKYENILINDLDQFGLELLEYIGQTRNDIYLGKNYENPELWTFINNPSIGDAFKFLNLNELSDFDLNIPKDADLYDDQWYLVKIENGLNIGYKRNNLVYPEDLILEAGSSVTSLLDKIKDMLVEFEYFYNVDGQFVFQKKRNYLQSAWSGFNPQLQGTVFINSAEKEEYQYIFEDLSLIQSINYSPNFSNVKNDFSILGERTSTTGTKIPILFRCAIDKKPTDYHSIEVTEDEVSAWNDLHPDARIVAQKGVHYSVNTPNAVGSEEVVGECDWRELIYQMALDSYNYGHLSNFTSKLIERNGYINGKTNYEQYYVDLLSFWRDLYDIDGNLHPKPNNLLTSAEVQQRAESEETEPTKKNVYIKDTIIEEYTNITYHNWADEKNILLLAPTILANQKIQSTLESLYVYDKDTNTLVPFIAFSDLSHFEALYAKDKDITSFRQYYYPNLLNTNISKAKNFTKIMIKGEGNKVFKSYPQTFQWLATWKYCENQEYKFYTIRQITASSSYRQLIPWPTAASKWDTFYYNQGYPETYYLRNVDSDYNFKEIVAKPITYHYVSNWDAALTKDPSKLNFWFDFIDSQGEIAAYRTNKIGDRSKIEKDSKIAVIKYQNVPNIIFTFEGEQMGNIPGYTVLNAQGMKESVQMSSKSISCSEKATELLNTYACCTSGVSISLVPIYYLEPNRKIKIFDNKTKRYKDYTINSISYSLGANGTMSLSANEIINRIY